MPFPEYLLKDVLLVPIIPCFLTQTYNVIEINVIFIVWVLLFTTPISSQIALRDLDFAFSSFGDNPFRWTDINPLNPASVTYPYSLWIRNRTLTPKKARLQPGEEFSDCICFLVE